MARRIFDFFYIELCCALGCRIPRYALWLELARCGGPPERLSPEALIAFFDAHLDAFLARERVHLPMRERARLRRILRRHDPQIATPYEVMERIGNRLDA